MKNISKKVMKVPKPNQIKSFFKLEKFSLTLVTISGILYNVGMIAGPYFEGRLAQCLFDIISGKKTFSSMLTLALIYLIVILFVQSMRALKRYYVRQFANNTSRNMRHMLYNSLVNMDKEELEKENIGAIMTKAVSDVDTCTEGMRKFTTEVFDTGVVLIAYLGMLFYYDWRLTLISCIFTPIAYYIAERLKKRVTRYNSEYKKSAEKLNNATMDRVSNAITYRIYGCDESLDAAYEVRMKDYEKRAVSANFWENTMQPLYHIISMCGIIFVIYIGAKNVNGTGFTSWNIAAFTTFLSCFAKMALKSSHAAKLFNSVQKAEVSWGRIKPLMKEYVEQPSSQSNESNTSSNITLNVKDLNVEFDSTPIISDISFKAKAGDIIGVTGTVACGKSTLGKALLGELPYKGSIKIDNRELNTISLYERSMVLSYLGHEPELMTESIEENIRLGDEKGIDNSVKAVCLTDEINEMPQGAKTSVGSGGIRLSGGQQARLALARTCYHARSILILDDPFSAVDKKTEEEIFANIQLMATDKIVIIISHRLEFFPKLSNVLFIENSHGTFSTHEKLLNTNPSYQALYLSRENEGASYEE